MSASWITKLTESDSRLHKEQVIEQALVAAQVGSDNADVFLRLAKKCYDPYVTFGVKQVPVGASDSQENPWQDFMQLLEDLENRELTGNSAREAINEMSERFHHTEWNLFCAPVIRRDLRCGVSDKTINKICKKTKYEIPVFVCQLATSCDDRPEMRGLKRLEVKLDGVRVLMGVYWTQPGCAVQSQSRNGKLFDNFGHIEDQVMNHIAPLLRKNPLFAQGFILDGEVVGESFQQLMRQARRKENAETLDTVFHVFDIIPLADFARGYWNAQLRKRVEILESLQPVIQNTPNVQLLDHLIVNLDTEQGVADFHKYCNDTVAQGFEGVMIKDLESPYECKRNTSWLKYKPTVTVDLTVVGVEEGTGKNKGRLGALICEGMDDNRFIQVNVGSGFTDSERDVFWLDRNLIVGRTVEVLCDVITQNQDGTYSLRFPRFVRFRDDK
jgi:DNA ligase 1